MSLDYLDSEQQQLLIQLVEFERDSPAEGRKPFIAILRLNGTQALVRHARTDPDGPDLSLVVYKGTFLALDKAGMFQAQQRSKDSVVFDMSARALATYDRLARGEGGKKMEPDIETVRGPYKELRSMSQTAPQEKQPRGDRLPKHLAKIIDSLNAATGNDYSDFKVETSESTNFGPFFDRSDYLSAVNTLKARLESDFPALSGVDDASSSADRGAYPSIVINNTNNQTVEQSLHLQVITPLVEFLDKRKESYPEGTKERTFLDTFRSTVGAAKDIVGVVGALVAAAAKAGLTLHDIPNIFH